MAIEDKIKLLKEVHLKRQQRQKKSLGDVDSEEEEDTTSSWVQKARKLREEKILAERRATLLAQIELEEKDNSDHEDPVAFRQEKREKAAKERSDVSAVEGVKVLHQWKDLPEGELVELTLADTLIVKDGVINDEDELISIKLVETEKIKKYNDIRTGKRKYDVYGDSQSEILPQYDSDTEKKEKNKRAFSIGENGDIQLTTEDQLKIIKNKLEEDHHSKAIVDGTFKVREAVDYYTSDELVQFRKSTKEKTSSKKKMRKKNLRTAITPTGRNCGT